MSGFDFELFIDGLIDRITTDMVKMFNKYFDCEGCYYYDLPGDEPPCKDCMRIRRKDFYKNGEEVYDQDR